MYREEGLLIQWGIRIPLRDGVTLSADLYLPAAVEYEEAAVPAIVVRTPYGKSGDVLVEQGRFFARNGYAVVNVDVRGRGDSEGEFVPYRNEGKDGYDVIEWAAGQSWCTGHVGTLGGSYLGRIQWLTALHQPPHLKAMIPLVTPSDPFVEWPLGNPDPMHLCWLFMTADRGMQNVNQVDWARVYRHLPLITMDKAAGRPMEAWKVLFEHTCLDDWWKELSYQTRFHELNVPVMHISGWYDDEQIGTPLNYAGMSTQAKSEWARKAQRLIMGPWPHKVNASMKIGEIDFGPSALVDLRGRQLRFFDRWLKGLDNGLDDENPVSIFVMGRNEWREEKEWPLARTHYEPWYLHSQGRANSSYGDGMLSPLKPMASASTDEYTYDPANPVPFITEQTSAQIGGPDDYSAIHRRDDVLVYTSEPLTSELEVTGPVRVKLFASSTAHDTDFMAQLHDVWPNGYVQRLCDGMVRARFRHGMETVEWMHPNTVYPFEIDCWNTSHVFLPGHRIRLHITSSAFPKYDRNPNTGEPLGRSTNMVSAHQTVHHSEVYPSAVILPVIPPSS